MLMQLGTCTFEVSPVNIDGWEREAIADFAVKDTMGNLRPREFMGEGEDSIRMGGTLYPHKLGGFSSIEEMDRLRKSGTAQLLVRGDGKKMGWYLIDRFSERHTYLDQEGVGKKIEFELSLVLSAKPSPASYIATLIRLVGSI